MRKSRFTTARIGPPEVALALRCRRITDYYNLWTRRNCGDSASEVGEGKSGEEEVVGGGGTAAAGVAAAVVVTIAVAVAVTTGRTLEEAVCRYDLPHPAHRDRLC